VDEKLYDGWKEEYARSNVSTVLFDVELEVIFFLFQNKKNLFPILLE